MIRLLGIGALLLILTGCSGISTTAGENHVPTQARSEPRTAANHLKTTAQPSESALQEIAMIDIFYNQENFIQAVTAVDSSPPDQISQIVVVPHHLLAADIIARGIAALEKNVDTIVVLGPNHTNGGPYPITTGLVAYQTPYGKVQTNEYFHNQVMDLSFVGQNEEIFNREHSVGAIVPFIQYYQPEASILPLALADYVNMKQVEQLTNWLQSQENIAIVVSTDFSHFLTEPEADANDKITRELLLNQNYQELLSLGNDFVDCPAALITAMKLARTRELKLDIFKQANSNDYTDSNTAETTSYFGISFVENVQF